VVFDGLKSIDEQEKMCDTQYLRSMQKEACGR